MCKEWDGKQWQYCNCAIMHIVGTLSLKSAFSAGLAILKYIVEMEEAQS